MEIKQKTLADHIELYSPITEVIGADRTVATTHGTGTSKVIIKQNRSHCTWDRQNRTVAMVGTDRIQAAAGRI